MSAAEAIAPEPSVDEVRQSLSVTDKGKTANTIDNCRIVFCCDPLLRDAIRLNLLTDRVDIVQDLGWRRNTSALTDTDVKYLLLYFERNYELTSEKKITAALSIVANENCYHPIQDVLNSLNRLNASRIEPSAALATYFIALSSTFSPSAFISSDSLAAIVSIVIL